MASEKLSPLIHEVTRERDRALQWKLISFSLAQGLKILGTLVVNKDKENIFIQDIQLILEWIKTDNLEDLYKFFCENDQLE